nr:hypothetical protein BaRGS_033119 [Batillaria attramentaria]
MLRKDVDAKVLDGAAIVQMLSPKLAKTFQQYVDLIFLPYIQRQFETASQVEEWLRNLLEGKYLGMYDPHLNNVPHVVRDEVANLECPEAQDLRLELEILNHLPNLDDAMWEVRH